MLKNDFEQLVSRMVTDEGATISGKGEEYTHGSKDRLASFKETAAATGMSPKQVCLVYMSKHWQALCNFVATGEVKSNEDVTSRIMDLRVYLALMRAIIEEERGARKN